MNNVINIQVVRTSDMGVCRVRIVSGSSSNAGWAWNTNKKKARKWSKISAKKYHQRPMLGVRSSAR